ncbi:MAG: outer membrane protein assembly factor BamD [Cellvibrionales bacterium]|nr:outer membrane protein assembly factor BamD [Cellvibrionales bacterium]
MKLRVFVFLLVGLLASCAWFGGEEEVETAEAELYRRALASLDSGQSRTAIEYLQLLEAQFPFGKHAEQAQLELIYAHYRAFDHDAATAAAERFIRLHPTHPNVDYAYYMLGLVSFTRDLSPLSQFLPVDGSTRDLGSARDSFAQFSDLLARFPNSPYAADARKRLVHLRNILARSEINTANYYLKRRAYLAAVNRGKYVVENFPRSPAVPDGLAIMAQGYRLLGFDEQAENAIRVLAANYADHPALADAGAFDRARLEAETQRSWVNRATLGIFDKPRVLGFDTRALYNPVYVPRS